MSKKCKIKSHVQEADMGVNEFHATIILGRHRTDMEFVRNGSRVKYFLCSGKIFSGRIEKKVGILPV